MSPPVIWIDCDWLYLHIDGLYICHCKNTGTSYSWYHTPLHADMVSSGMDRTLPTTETPVLQIITLCFICFSVFENGLINIFFVYLRPQQITMHNYCKYQDSFQLYIFKINCKWCHCCKHICRYIATIYWIYDAIKHLTTQCNRQTQQCGVDGQTHSHTCFHTYINTLLRFSTKGNEPIHVDAIRVW